MPFQKFNTTIIGAGMVACDDIYKDGRFSLRCVGGTCGNVLSYAAAFSHQCFLVSRIGDDEAGNLILEEMRRLGISTDFLITERHGTPRIAGHVFSVDGRPHHEYSFYSPDTNEQFPRFRSPTLMHIQKVCGAVPNPGLFYCDRLTDATIQMARTYAAAGTPVMVEPSDTTSARRVGELAGAITILKASAEHLSLDDPIWRSSGAHVRVLTLGERGVAFYLTNHRTAKDGIDGASWKFLRPIMTTPVVDTIGAGDAFSGALIASLFAENRRDVTWDWPHLQEAVRFAQNVAELSCRGAGPRWLLDDEALQFVAIEKGQSKWRFGGQSTN